MSESTVPGGAGNSTVPGGGNQQAPAPWYQGVAGVDEALIGHIKNRGLDGKSAAEAAINFARGHIEAEKLIGVPADQMVRLPKDAADEPAINALWSKLGRPADAAGYDLSGAKFPDGTPLDEGFVKTIKEAAFRMHMPATMAAGMAAEFAKFMANTDASEATEKAAALAVERDALAKNWGANAEANRFVASQAVRALGLPPETVATLESVVGYSKVMEMFRDIGTRIGEARYVQGGPAAPGVMTREQAVARREELKRDGDWVNSYMAGDAAKAREMTALNVLIAGAN